MVEFAPLETLGCEVFGKPQLFHRLQYCLVGLDHEVIDVALLGDL